MSGGKIDRARSVASLVMTASAVMTLILTTTAVAQTPQPGRGGGGGRGRGAIQVMTLNTPAFNDGGVIPVKHTQPGRDVSPALSWSGVPDSNVASFALIVHDANAPIGNGTDDLLHWMVWNIPGSARSLPEGISHGPNLPDGARQISASGPYYRGPAAPSTGPPHHYVYELYALDTMLDVPAVGQSPPLTRAAVVAAMASHIRGKAVMVATFKRAAP
jgi:Raf kinase inhibitor-like YbhB/YbcL family protein